MISLQPSLEIPVNNGYSKLARKIIEAEQSNTLTGIFLGLADIKNLHEFLPYMLKQLVQIMPAEQAELLFIENKQCVRFWQTVYSEKQSSLINGQIETNPVSIGDDPMVEISAFTSPKLIPASYWTGRYSNNTLLFKKITSTAYSYFFPIMHHGQTEGIISIKTNAKAGFTANDLMIITAISKFLIPLLLNQYAYNQNEYWRESQRALLLFNLDISLVRTRKDFQHFIKERLPSMTGADTILVTLINTDRLTYSQFVQETNDSASAATYPVNDGMFEKILSASSPIVFNLQQTENLKRIPALLRTDMQEIKTVAGAALKNSQEQIGVIFLGSKNPLFFSKECIEKISCVAVFLSAAIQNIISYETIERQVKEISDYRFRLESENMYLQEELQQTHNYADIIGTSNPMRKVFQLVSQVSATQSSVLILGETGTGKELIARAIHNTSPRRNKVMVKVNCATLPANLIESELFGHEKGSFTGAIEKRIGKFELANNSTLFLDEIGELPLDLQVKLLRALQEKEIERIGGRSVIKTDVRIVAATNRNLQKEVQQGRFRSDLYFRLNVFPITIPPLRDRKEDIPILASHFLIKHTKNNSKNGMNFSAKVIKELSAYNWPGNVRELEHLIERSILLAAGQTINSILLPACKEDTRSLLPESYIKTIDEIEKEYIISILKKCNGKVAGIGGAAELLRIPSTTLNSKIKRLNIKKGFTNVE